MKEEIPTILYTLIYISFVSHFHENNIFPVVDFDLIDFNSFYQAQNLPVDITRKRVRYLFLVSAFECLEYRDNKKKTLIDLGGGEEELKNKQKPSLLVYFAYPKS